LFLISFAFSCGGSKSRPQQPAAKPAPAAASSPQQSKERPPLQKPLPSPGIDESSGTDKSQTESADTLPQQEEIKDSPPQGPAPYAGSGAGPDIRIGLDTSAKEIRISAPETFYVQAKNDSARRQTRGDIYIRVAQENQGSKTAPAPQKSQGTAQAKTVYQIQAVSLSNPENAAKVRDSLAGKLGVPVAVRLNPDTGMNQIRIGEFSTREEAQNYLPNVRRDYPDAFVVTGETMSGGGNSGGSESSSGGGSSSGSGRTVVTLSGADNLNLRSADGFRIYPASATAFLRVNGKAYRGSFDVSLNKSGRLTLVNQLPMEDYLLGVVPAEMSPGTYPEFAALAAQAIAARTYALKNMGRYRSDGFDLTNDTRTQVYGGVEMEKSATNDIVLQTSGVAVYYDGKLIDAMFMSTCGGRTEDFGLVYGTNSVPYLKSVPCAVDHEHEDEGVTLAGTQGITGTFRAADGSLANRNIELARVIGLIPLVASVTADSLSAPVGADEAKRLIDAAAAITKTSRRVPAQASGIAARGGFLRQAADVFFGGDEIQRRISRSDQNYYMANLTDGAAVPEALRPTIAYLMQRKLWRPTSENAVDALTPLRRGDAIALLMDWIEAEKQDIMRRGNFVDAGERKTDKEPDILNIKSGSSGREFRLARNLILFRIDPGQITPVREMKLIGAEKLAFHLNDKNEIDFIEIELSPSGAASDRLSYAATWQMTLTRTSAAEKLRDLAGDIGTFMDIQPSRLGFSGRAVQIKAVGSRRTAELNGYRVRSALGLRDTLFTLTREYNAEGAVTSFTFSGRGYGHGVGLCQTGAYGMAKAGRNYTEILKTYYTGVDIKKAY
jgi:stage II sporulation protein D